MAEKVTNGTFESWSSATDADDWTETLAGTSTVNRESTAANVYAGTYSCRLDIDASNNSAKPTQAITLVAGNPYRLSVRYKMSATGKTGRVFLYDSTPSNVCLDEDGSWVAVDATDAPALDNATDWTEFVIPFTAHASYTAYTLQVYNLSAASSSIWIDNVSILEPADGLIDQVTSSVTLSDQSGAGRDTVYDSVSVKDNFKYYLASAEGKIFTYDKDYLSDDGATIVSRWRSKTLDFVDQIPACHDAFKTVNSVKLFYKDLTTTTPVTISVSTDSGQTWEWVTKNLGTGTDAILSADFEFLKTGEFFVFAIEHSSTNKEFMWLKAEINVTPGGPHFVV